MDSKGRKVAKVRPSLLVGFAGTVSRCNDHVRYNRPLGGYRVSVEA
jgi:hypothetical protein